MHMKDVLNKCKEMGHPMTAMGIYTAGEKYGFLNKLEGKHYYDFDKGKFLEWLNNAIAEIPKGWVTLNEASKILNVSLPQMYILVKHENSGAKYFGAGKGVMYVDPKRIEEIIRERKAKHEYMWGDEDGAD